MTTYRGIYCSGWASDHRTMEPLAEKLAPQLEPTTVDWWKCIDRNPEGFLRFEPDADNPMLAALARDPNRPAVLIGWSLGGMLAMRAALTMPDQVRALVLIATTPRLTANGELPGTDPAALRAMITRFARQTGRVLSDFHRACLEPHFTTEAFEFFAGQVVAMNHQPLADGLRYLEQEDLRSLTPGLIMPTLVIHGRADEIVPVAAGRWLVSQLPQAHWVELPDRGHALPYSATDEIAKHTRSFLSELSD